MDKDEVFNKIDLVKSIMFDRMQKTATDDYGKFLVSYTKDMLLIYCEELKRQIEKSVEEEDEAI